MRIGLMREVTANPRLQNPPWQIIYADKSGGKTSATNRVLEGNAKTMIVRFYL
jgi:hypothetical protein